MIKHADLQKSMAHPSVQPNSCCSNDCIIDQICIFFLSEIMFLRMRTGKMPKCCEIWASTSHSLAYLDAVGDVHQV